MSVNERDFLDLQARVLAHEILFQRIFYSLPVDVKQDIQDTIKENFTVLAAGTSDEMAKIKLEAARSYASRVSGADI